MLLARHEEALSCFDRALEIWPDSVETLNNKAFSLARLHRFDEAFAVYARSKAAAPDNAATDFNVALLRMLTGSFAAGWLGREASYLLPVEYHHLVFTLPGALPDVRLLLTVPRE